MCQNLNQSIVILILLTMVYKSTTTGQLLSIKEHRTPGATQRINDLWCYQCDTMEDGERCADLSANNSSSFIKKCDNEKRICMIKIFSHTMSTENSTSVLRMWSLERNCTKHCEAGCIVIGERTKLHACTSCCEESYCNKGKGGAASTLLNNQFYINFLMLLVLITMCGPILS